MSRYDDEPFDATDLEIARREHLAECGVESASDRAWSWFSDKVEAIIKRNGWGDTLDMNYSEAGFCIDFALDAFEAGKTPEQYLDEVKGEREHLGLSV